MAAIMRGVVVRRLLPIMGAVCLATQSFFLFAIGSVIVAGVRDPECLYPPVALIAIGNPTMNALISERSFQQDFTGSD